MAEISNRALPKGSTVLVTGANGFLGAHIADQFLAQGYKVRGTVRDTKRDAWLVDHFGKLYGKDNFELVAVTEMEKEGAFDEAVKGVDAVAHSAGVMSFDHDPNKVIPITIAGAVNALKSAYAEPSVKRFVLTSSSAAALSANTPAGSVITVETWNEQAVKDAWADPPYTPERASTVYFASKTQSEQAVWKFHKENRAKRPDLVVNAVLPHYLFGPTLDPVHHGFRSTASFVVGLWLGQISDYHRGIQRPWFVDARDAALLHVAGVIFPDLEDQRIFAFGGAFTWDAVLDVLRKHDPQRKLPEDFSAEVTTTVIEPRDKAESLLRRFGHLGWRSLEESVIANIQGVDAAM